MRATSSTYKHIIASGDSRNFVVTVNMTLADNTSLTLTEEDIMQGSFKILSASSNPDSFDLGAAVIGKCQFTLNNYDDSFTEYDFFNATATVWVGLVGDTNNGTQVYHRMGFFTVDEPQIAGSLISLELLDNMWKFDRPIPTLAWDSNLTCLNVVNALCTECGVVLATQNFHGYNYVLTKAPEQEMNCRELLQYVAMIGCNFCVIDSQGYLRIRWYNAPANVEANLDGGSFSTSTTPYSDGDSADGGNFTNYNSGDSYDGGSFFDSNVPSFTRLMTRNIGTDEITITGVKFTIEETDYKIGTDGYVLSLENPLVDTSNVSAILNLIWDVLSGTKIRTFNVTALPDLSPEVGDYCAISYKGNMVYSYLTNYTFTPSLATASLGAVTPTRSLSTRYSKAVQTAVEMAREKTKEYISDYDLAVQMMNNLAVQAMGGYEFCEELSTGGRRYYLSNQPITEDSNGVLFTEHSTVFMMSGDGFFVTQDSTTRPSTSTWTNGYNTQTGQLVVNVLYAIGISAEWIKTGVLDVGGRGTAATIRVHDSTTQETVIVTIDADGIKMKKGAIYSSDYTDTSPVSPLSATGMKIDIDQKFIKTPNFGLDMTNGLTLNKGAIQSADYAYSQGHFSTDGTKFDITNDYLRSKYFAFDENGAYINGEVQATSGQIGGATITQNSIVVSGDIELYNGSGTFTFRPTDYYFAEDFKLKFHTEGSSTVTLVKHENGSDTTVGTYTVTSSQDVESATLDHTIGTDPDDYYQVTVSGSSTSVLADDVILAYMGANGIRGVMEGIFKGHIEANGTFKGRIESNEGIISGVTYDDDGNFVENGTTFNVSQGWTFANDNEVNVASDGISVHGETNANVGVGAGNTNNQSSIAMVAPYSGKAFVQRMIPSTSDPSLYVSDLALFESNLRYGANDPSGGEDGDIYVQNNGLQITKIWQKVGGSWLFFERSGGGTIPLPRIRSYGDVNFTSNDQYICGLQTNNAYLFYPMYEKRAGAGWFSKMIINRPLQGNSTSFKLSTRINTGGYNFTYYCSLFSGASLTASNAVSRYRLPIIGITLDKQLRLEWSNSSGDGSAVQLDLTTVMTLNTWYRCELEYVDSELKAYLRLYDEDDTLIEEKSASVSRRGGGGVDAFYQIGGTPGDSQNYSKYLVFDRLNTYWTVEGAIKWGMDYMNHEGGAPIIPTSEIATPIMASNSQPYGQASASSELYWSGNSYYACKAFQQVRNDGIPWHTGSNSGIGAWLKYKFDSKIVITRVETWSVAWAIDPSSLGDVCCKQFKFQASNDDSTWTDLATCNCQALVAGDASTLHNDFTIPNNTAYLYYRLYITQLYSPNRSDVAFACVNMYE